MNLEPFFERCKSFPEAKSKWTNAFCNLLTSTFADDDDYDFSQNEMITLLFYGKGNSLGRAKFNHYKTYVIEFYQWLFEEKKIDARLLERIKEVKYKDIDSSRELEKYYFKNLESALSFIRAVGTPFGLSGKNDMPTLKSIVILAWYGISFTEMVEIKKSDLIVAENAVQIRGGNNRRAVEIDKESFELLRDYANSDFQISFPGGRRETYVPSQYLFRSHKQAKATVKSLLRYLQRFNEEAAPSQSLSVDMLAKNGVFVKVLENEDSGRSVNALLEEFAGCDKFVASGYAAVYKKWKEKYYIFGG